MANTKSSAKRARQSVKKQAVNKRNRSVMKTAVKNAVDKIKSKQVDQNNAEAQLKLAISALGKAGSKGAIPKKRASRKISRLTLLAKKILTEKKAS
jgi:small subunit ribosomal protein S20